MTTHARSNSNKLLRDTLDAEMMKQNIRTQNLLQKAFEGSHRDMGLAIEKAAQSIKLYGVDSDNLEADMKDLAEAVSEQQKSGRSGLRFCVDVEQTQTIVLPALHSTRHTIVAAAVEIIKGTPVREGFLPDEVFFGLFNRLAQILSDPDQPQYTLQHTAATIPRFFGVPRCQAAIVSSACENGLVSSLFDILSSSTVYKTEEESLRSLQQKAAYILWFLFGNVQITGAKQERYKHQFVEKMTSTAALERLIFLCTVADSDGGRVQRIALKTIHSFVKLGPVAASAVAAAGGLEVATQVVSRTGPTSGTNLTDPVHQESFRQATLLAADLVMVQPIPGHEFNMHSPESPMMPSLANININSGTAFSTPEDTPRTVLYNSSGPGTPNTTISTAPGTPAGAGLDGTPDFRRWPSKKLKDYLKEGRMPSTGVKEKVDLVSMAQDRYKRDTPTGTPVVSLTANATSVSYPADAENPYQVIVPPTTPRELTTAVKEPTIIHPEDADAPSPNLPSPNSVFVSLPDGSVKPVDSPTVGETGRPAVSAFQKVSGTPDRMSSGGMPPVLSRSSSSTSGGSKGPFQHARLPSSGSLNTPTYGSGSMDYPTHTRVPSNLSSGSSTPTTYGRYSSGISPAGSSLNPVKRAPSMPSPQPSAPLQTQRSTTSPYATQPSPTGYTAPTMPKLNNTHARSKSSLPAFGTMTVSQLRHLLGSLQVDYSNCVEKRELVALCEALPPYMMLPAVTRAEKEWGDMPEFKPKDITDKDWHYMVDILVEILAKQIKFSKKRGSSLSAICGLPPTALNSPNPKALAMLKNTLKTKLGIARVINSNLLGDTLTEASDAERTKLAECGLLVATTQHLRTNDIDTITPCLTALAIWAEVSECCELMWEKGLFQPMLTTLVNLPTRESVCYNASKNHSALMASLKLFANALLPGDGLRTDGEVAADVEANFNIAGRDAQAKRLVEWFVAQSGIIRVHDILRFAAMHPEHMDGLNHQYKYLKEKHKASKFPSYQCLRVLRYALVAEPNCVSRAIMNLPDVMNTILVTLENKEQSIEISRAAASFTASLCKHSATVSAKPEQVQLLNQVMMLSHHLL